MAEVQDTFYEILKSLCDVTLAWRQEKAEAQKMMSPLAWHKEMCTVSCGSCRQIGHSVSALKLANYYMDKASAPFEAWFVSPKKTFSYTWQRKMTGLINPFNRTLIDIIPDTSRLKHFRFTTQQSMDDQLRGEGKHVGMVFVDCTSYTVGRKMRDLIYRDFTALTWNYPELFVFLQ
jgi:hypothetical protein